MSSISGSLQRRGRNRGGHRNGGPSPVKGKLCFNCGTTEMLQRMPSDFVTPSALDVAIDAHTKAFVACHGTDNVGPKLHWMQHFGTCLRDAGKLLNCWVHERKHKVAKRFGTFTTNTSQNWEGDVLEECTNLHFDQLERGDAHASLAMLLSTQRLRK